MTSAETKTCQNCKAPFTIEPDDFSFYEKMAVPAPTFCPQCRMQRRMVFRNERALFKRNCDLCHKPFIGAYRGGTRFPIYCPTCWWGDGWDSRSYAAEYDASRPFLAQWKDLQSRVPRPSMNNYTGATLLNSDYTNCSGELKNCYLIFGCLRDEDCLYSHYLNDSRDCIDVLYGARNEHCYECSDIENCFELSHAQSCLGCRTSAYLFDCRNCSDCIGCVGLRNKQYHILNSAYSKEDYERKKAELKLDTRSGQSSFVKAYQALRDAFPRKYYHGQMNHDFSGDYVANVENTHEVFYTKNARGCKFMFWCTNARDVYDYMSWGDMELSYECISSGANSYRSLFAETSWGENKEVEYSGLCFNSSFLFGCIGLRNKQYCILNRQYSEEEYHALRKTIIEDMKKLPYKDKQGISYPYGEFFPIELSPFPYNDTVAQEYFPMSPAQAAERGFAWGEAERRDYAITMAADAVPDAAADIQDAAVNEVIQCAHDGRCEDQCVTAFKLVPHEIQFYKKYGIPLPTLCHNCRHAVRVAMRNPLKLWNRACQCAGKASEREIYANSATHFHGEGKCPNVFRTSYAPDRPEIVYCEQCYQAEVA